VDGTVGAWLHEARDGKRGTEARFVGAGGGERDTV